MSPELRQAKDIEIKICNKGVVPKVIRDHFFKKYITFGKKGGTGLGTYSAKLMADVMRYDLSMETSDTARTTCLRLLMPVEAQKE